MTGIKKRGLRVSQTPFLLSNWRFLRIRYGATSSLVDGTSFIVLVSSRESDVAILENSSISSGHKFSC